jgi:hypothetical protein
MTMDKLYKIKPLVWECGGWTNKLPSDALDIDAWKALPSENYVNIIVKWRARTPIGNFSWDISRVGDDLLLGVWVNDDGCNDDVKLAYVPIVGEWCGGGQAHHSDGGVPGWMDRALKCRTYGEMCDCCEELWRNYVAQVLEVV